MQPFLEPSFVNGYMKFDSEECTALGKEFHEQYVGAEPFPHIKIDNFLPTELLRTIVSEFPKREVGRFSDAHSNLKTGYQLEKIKGATTNCLINALNSAAFLDFLEALTGISGLIGDPHQSGGGLHETARGGHLSIHADFNRHTRLNLVRRLNLILFLNEGWKDEFGGKLELWSKDMSRCEKSITPVIGTAVIFNTDSDSFHGHPDPLTCPEGVYRRSLALYYFNAPDDLKLSVPRRTTDFRVRPGSTDRPQLAMKARELARDLVPPILYRLLKK